MADGLEVCPLISAWYVRPATHSEQNRYSAAQHPTEISRLIINRPVPSRFMNIIQPLVDGQLLFATNFVLVTIQFLRYAVSAKEYDRLCNGILLSALLCPSLYKHRRVARTLYVKIGRGLSCLTFLLISCSYLCRQPTFTMLPIEQRGLDCRSNFFPIWVICEHLESMSERAGNAEYYDAMSTLCLAAMFLFSGMYLLSLRPPSILRAWERPTVQLQVRRAGIFSKGVFLCATWLLVILYWVAHEQTYLDQYMDRRFFSG